jgi:pimeloyl-ACP methyl ester carboxylesterase/DNA-binding NarL/FixJ family response regulator
MVEAMASAGMTYVDGVHQPLFKADAIAAALVDRHGRVLSESPAFAALGGSAVLDLDLVARVADGLAATTAVAALPGSGDSAVFAYGPASRASGWRLPPGVAEAAVAHPGHVVVLTGHAGRVVRPLEEACHAYGLSGLQTRVVLETIRTGNARHAAAAAGVTYHTAREALTEAMRRGQARRLPAFVQQLSSLAFGVLPSDDAGDVLGDLWGLSSRQAAIAGLIADGLSRGEAAAALGLSEAVVKKELDRTYLILQVDSASALARRLVEARALAWLVRATSGDIGYLDPALEPLQFVPRPGGGRIAISDYGPAGGRPVILAHPPIYSRITPRPLVRALQTAGYRPIAIDRPGFGLTDEYPNAQAGQHDCWATAARDGIAVLDALRLRTVDLMSHQGSGHYAVEQVRRAPERFGRVVLVNPDPDSPSSRYRSGPWGIMKDAFMRYPALIRAAVGAMARQFEYEAIIKQFQDSSRGSPPDEAAFRDPEICRGVFLAMRPLATGRYEGVVNEEVVIARPIAPAVLPGATNWKVLLGAHDTLHHPPQVHDYWKAVLPDAAFEISPLGGRMIAYSHPHLAVAALKGD